MKDHKKKVLLVKHWMESHDRGVKSVAMILRDNGFEVIYTAYTKVEEIVSAAIQEDVDVIGLSFSTKAYEVHIPELMALLKKEGLSDVMVIAGGIIPAEDGKILMAQGVAGVFAAGADTQKLISLLNDGR